MDLHHWVYYFNIFTPLLTEIWFVISVPSAPPPPSQLSFDKFIYNYFMINHVENSYLLQEADGKSNKMKNNRDTSIELQITSIYCTLSTGR